MALELLLLLLLFPLEPEVTGASTAPDADAIPATTEAAEGLLVTAVA